MNLKIDSSTDLESLVNEMANSIMLTLLTQMRKALSEVDKGESVSADLSVRMHINKNAMHDVVERNEVTVNYKEGNLFCSDNINIDVRNASKGALYFLAKLMENEYEKNKSNEGGFANDAYTHLLDKLSVKIKEAVNY